MNASQEKEKIHGYDYGTDKVAKSPITMENGKELKKIGAFLGRGRSLSTAFQKACSRIRLTTC
jgi:hypothetical protein